MAEDLIGLGKIAEAAERATREMRELVQEFLSPIARESGEYFADRVRFARATRAKQALEIAKGQVTASGMEQKPIEPKILAPALEGASLEEDDDLTARWAGLIATAATTGETLPAFADILRQLTPEEARLLDFVYAMAKPHPVIDTAVGVERKALREVSALDEEAFTVRLQNLSRLGLIVRSASGGFPTMAGDGWDTATDIGLTFMGRAFVRACRGPEKLVLG